MMMYLQLRMLVWYEYRILVQVGLAVGTTDTDLKDATFNKIALQVIHIILLFSLYIMISG